MKWANSDKIVELITQNPALEPLLIAHLMDIENALAAIQAAMAPAGPDGSNGSNAPNAQGPKGSAVAAKNSNSESGGSQNASDHTQPS